MSGIHADVLLNFNAPRQVESPPRTMV